MDEIRNWLSGTRGYDAGIKLYALHGKDPLLKKLFQEDYSDFKMQKLHQVMQQLASSGIIESKPSKASEEPAILTASVHVSEFDEIKDQVEELTEEKEELQDQVYELENENEDLQEENKKLKSTQKNAPRGWPADMDETIRSLHDQWLPVFVKKKNLQARLYDIALAGQKDPDKKKEAGAMAHEILDLRDQCRAIYKQRDHYLVHKKLPEEPKLLDIPVDPNKWPLALNNYQRYVRHYKNKLTKKPDSEDFKKQLAKYEWAVIEVKKLMRIT